MGASSSNGDSSDQDNSFTLTLTPFTCITIVSALLYLMMQLYVQRKLRLLHLRSPTLDTKKLFVMSVWLACCVRFMSFVGLSALTMAQVQVNYSLSTNDNVINTDDSKYDANQAFYDKAVIVLFDLPDYIIVSTYVLLTMVWGECFLESRYHTMKNHIFRKTWLIVYMVFNGVLYGGQMVLYLILFISDDNVFFGLNLRNLLFVIVTGINFVVVIFMWILYFYLSLKFSGFPFKSEHAKRSFGKISQVIFYWSLARIVWGIAMLIAYSNNIGWVSDGDNSLWSLVLIVLIMGCELGPIFVAMDYSLINIIGLSSQGITFAKRGINSGLNSPNGEGMYEPLPDADRESIANMQARVGSVGGGLTDLADGDGSVGSESGGSAANNNRHASNVSNRTSSSII
jgi:hypothetical protein